MQFPLSQFEQYIDETILKRGLTYFRKGYVSEPEVMAHGVYKAIVTGSEDYTVSLTVHNGMVTEHVCTCPYDMGPVCKHVAAVLFYVQQDELGIKPKAASLQPKQQAIAKKSKRKTIADQVNELLDKIPQEELKNFIREKTELHPAFRQLFLSAFTHQHSNESKALYAKQVKAILRAATGRGDFIYWNQAGNAGKQISKLLTTAQNQIATKNVKSAIFICTAVMEEMTAALQFADDSNGDIGGSIDLAFALLCQIAKEALPEDIRLGLLHNCLHAFEKGIYSGWDWHLGMMELAAELLTNKEEVEQVIRQLEKIQDSEYERDMAERIIYSIIRKANGEKEAEAFIELHLANPNLRREAIDIAITNEHFEKAINLAKDGITLHEKDKPGLAKEWYDWLLKIAQAQNDREKIVAYARYLFMSHFSNKQDYYQLLKTNVPSGQWTLFVEEIIQEITTKRRWPDTDLVAMIYIKEAWWDRLLKLLTQHPSLQRIEQFEKYLSTDYAGEIALLYEQSIYAYMQNSTGRSHYQIACRYLRRMLKLGARERVNEIIDHLRRQYPQRKALLEELDHV